MGDTILLIQSSDQSDRSASRLLAQCGFGVLPARDASSAGRLLERSRLACIVVSVSQEGDVEVCRSLRGLSTAPILALNARRDDRLVVRCLEAGADGVVGRPFSRRILEARIDAVRRVRDVSRPFEPRSESLRSGALVIDTDAHVATHSGRPLSLTPTEFRLLAALTRRAGRVASYLDLLSEVWGPAYRDRPELVRLYVRYLRRKLGDSERQPRLLLNQRGVGYRLVQSPQEANVA